MKIRNNTSKHLIILILITAFLSTGCESKIFKTERALWKAYHLSKKIFENPTASSPYELNRAVEAYRKIVIDFSDDSQTTNRAQMSIAYIYLAKKNYDTARKEFSKLIINCDEKSNVCAEATFSVANCFEVEGDWDKAEQEYKKIMDSFYLTRKGLEVPVYLINKYKRSGEALQVKRAVNGAVNYYRGLKNKGYGENFSYLFQKLIAQCYLLAEDWPNFIKALDNIVEEFPINDELIARTLLTKAFVYEKQLKDEEGTMAIFDKIKKEYPETNTAKIVSAYLENKEKESKEQ